MCVSLQLHSSNGKYKALHIKETLYNLVHIRGLSPWATPGILLWSLETAAYFRFVLVHVFLLVKRPLLSTNLLGREQWETCQSGFSIDCGEQWEPISGDLNYSRVVGMLLYLYGCVCPNISHYISCATKNVLFIWKPLLLREWSWNYSSKISRLPIWLGCMGRGMDDLVDVKKDMNVWLWFLFFLSCGSQDCSVYHSSWDSNSSS